MSNIAFQDDLFSRTAMRSLLGLEVVAMIVVLGLSLSDLFVLALITSFLTLFVFIAVIYWLFMRYRAFPVVREKRELERLVLKFRRNIQAEANTIQASITERNRLFQSEKDEINTALRSLQRSYIDNGLASSFLKDAAIPGVGPKLKERLAGYGILSAAHVNNRISELPGFGEAKRQGLMAWRSTVLAALESTKPASLPHEQLQIIEQKYHALQDRNNAIERKAISSKQILEHELSSFQPQLQQLNSITFVAYLSKSMASRGLVAALIALILIVTQVVSSVSATGSAIIASIPTATATATVTLTPTNTLTPTATFTSTRTDTPTITFTPTITNTPTVTNTPLPTRTSISTITPIPPLPTSDPLQGVTAICNDGTYSYSQSSRGTCSHHGGVREWINKPPD
jgi:hypothetical protein